MKPDEEDDVEIDSVALRAAGAVINGKMAAVRAVEVALAPVSGRDSLERVQSYRVAIDWLLRFLETIRGSLQLLIL